MQNITIKTLRDYRLCHKRLEIYTVYFLGRTQMFTLFSIHYPPNFIGWFDGVGSFDCFDGLNRVSDGLQYVYFWKHVFYLTSKINKGLLESDSRLFVSFYLQELFIIKIADTGIGSIYNGLELLTHTPCLSVIRQSGGNEK